MSSSIIRVSEKWELDDGAEGVEYLLKGDTVTLGDGGEGECFLAGFRYVYYS